MPPLTNGKREKFACLLAEGVNVGAAYKQAGYTGGPSVASRLAKKEQIRKRMAEIQELAADETGVTVQMVIEELQRVAFSDMGDFVTWGPHGMALADSAMLDADASRCVSEVSESITKDGGSQRFKLHDKIRALELLGKHLGAFKADNEQREPPGRAVVVMDPNNSRD